jgi:TolB-like protein
VLDLAEQQLRCHGSLRELPPKGIALLALLVRHRRGLLTKQEILSHVWGKTHVSEALVKDYIKLVRRALDDDPDAPAHIETVRGRGYRYIGDLELLGLPPATPPLSAARAAPSIAVLNFADLRNGGADAYLGEGLAGDVIAGLSRYRQLVVISQLSSFRFGSSPEDQAVAAERLGAEWLLVGEVSRDSTRVRLRVTLTNTSTGRTAWSEIYDRPSAELVSLRDDVVQCIVATIAGQIERAQLERVLHDSMQEPNAHNLVLRARHALLPKTQEGVLAARELLSRAVAEYPSYAPAYTWLAETYYYETVSFWSKDPSASARRAFELGRRAIELDSWDSHAHLVLAWGYLRLEGSIEMARAQHRLALELNPNDYNALCFESALCLCLGEFQRAIETGLAALRRVPIVSDSCLFILGFAFFFAKDYVRAVDAFGRMIATALEIDGAIAAAYARLGRLEAACTAAARGCERYRTSASPARLDAQRWREYWKRLVPVRDEALFEDLLAALELAGLPAALREGG